MPTGSLPKKSVQDTCLRALGISQLIEGVVVPTGSLPNKPTRKIPQRLHIFHVIQGGLRPTESLTKSDRHF